MFRSIAHPKSWLQSLLARMSGEFGAVTAEYAILLALVAMAVIAAAITLGLTVAHLFDTGAESFPHA